jgi:hypothetical protein
MKRLELLVLAFSISFSLAESGCSKGDGDQARGAATETQQTFQGKSESEWVALSKDNDPGTRAGAYEALGTFHRADLLKPAFLGETDENYKLRAAIGWATADPKGSALALNTYISAQIATFPPAPSGYNDFDLEWKTKKLEALQPLISALKEQAAPQVPKLMQIRDAAAAYLSDAEKFDANSQRLQELRAMNGGPLAPAAKDFGESDASAQKSIADTMLSYIQSPK